MIKDKNKWITIGTVFLLFLVFTALAVHYDGKRTAAPSVGQLSDLEGKVLAGINTRLPKASMKLMAEGMLGVSLSAYEGFDSVDEILNAVRTGKAAAACFPDITAEYLASQYDEFTVISKEKKDYPRFLFGLAVKNDADGEILVSEINDALSELRSEKKLKKLQKTYISASAYNEIKFFSQHPDRIGEKGDTYKNYTIPADLLISASEMKHTSEKGASEWETINVAITGSVPPVELINENGEPCGYCVKLLDELAIKMKKRINIVVCDNDTVFTELMSGKIDAVFAYGAGQVTVEAKKNWLVSDGYLDVYDYSYLVLGSGGDALSEETSGEESEEDFDLDSAEE